MNYSELQEKYRALDSELTQLEVEAAVFDNPAEKKLREHPCKNQDWLNYARDQKFSFSCLRLPSKDDENWYQSVHEDIESYLKVMTVIKEFTICKNCGTRWTLDIQLDGTYNIYDQCGTVLIDWSNKDNFLVVFGIPKVIKTVKDLMYVIDVIEYNSHG